MTKRCMCCGKTNITHTLRGWLKRQLWICQKCLANQNEWRKKCGISSLNARKMSQA
jgi:hypothetical protein